jgi:hypothetical protein
MQSSRDILQPLLAQLQQDKNVAYDEAIRADVSGYDGQGFQVLA